MTHPASRFTQSPSDLMARRLSSLTGCPVQLVQRALHNTNTNHWLPESSDGLLVAAREAFVAQGVQIVNLMLGTGDAYFDVLTPPAEFAARMTTIISYLREGGMTVVLNAPPLAYNPPSGWNDASVARLMELHAACVALMETGAVWPGDTTSLGVFQQNLGHYTDDGIHPSRAGRIVLARLWAEKIAAVSRC